MADCNVFSSLRTALHIVMTQEVVEAQEEICPSAELEILPDVDRRRPLAQGCQT